MGVTGKSISPSRSNDFDEPRWTNTVTIPTGTNGEYTTSGYAVPNFSGVRARHITFFIFGEAEGTVSMEVSPTNVDGEWVRIGDVQTLDTPMSIASVHFPGDFTRAVFNFTSATTEVIKIVMKGKAGVA